MYYSNDQGRQIPDFIEADNAADDIINIPITTEIRYVEMAIFAGSVYTGLRLYDRNHNLMNGGMWDESAVEDSVWAE